jgi:hypothetical protein
VGVTVICASHRRAQRRRHHRECKECSVHAGFYGAEPGKIHGRVPAP